jgi:hypothetical protein
MEVTVDERSRVWTLNELTLNADGVVWMTNGTASVDVERGAIRLYGRAVGDLDPRLEASLHAPRITGCLGVSVFDRCASQGILRQHRARGPLHAPADDAR